jgi:hypothetical protein
VKEVMRGNFATQKKVVAPDAAEDLNTRFEREALKRLGGSIAFVSKKKFLFGLDQAKKDAKPE